MESGQRLTERTTPATDYSADDIDWFHFITDHKHYIRRESVIETYTPEEMTKYRFRPMEYCNDKCFLPSSAAWIFLFINDIRDPTDFNENCTKLYKFDRRLLEHLYQVYSTSENRSRDD